MEYLKEVLGKQMDDVYRRGYLDGKFDKEVEAQRAIDKIKGEYRQDALFYGFLLFVVSALYLIEALS